MIKKCECAGAVCSCGAEGIVKDGSAVRVLLSAMDEAPKSETPNLVGDAGDAWSKPVFDRANVPLKSDNDNSSKSQSAIDAANPWAAALHDHNKGHQD